MREIVHLQAGQCGNQIGAKVSKAVFVFLTTVSSYFGANAVIFAAGGRCFVPIRVPETTPWNINVSYLAEISF